MECSGIQVRVVGRGYHPEFLGWTVHGINLLCNQPLGDEVLELEMVQGCERVSVWGRAVWEQPLSRDGRYVVVVSSLAGQPLAQAILSGWRDPREARKIGRGCQSQESSPSRVA